METTAPAWVSFFFTNMGYVDIRLWIAIPLTGTLFRCTPELAVGIIILWLTQNINKILLLITFKKTWVRCNAFYRTEYLMCYLSGDKFVSCTVVTGQKKTEKIILINGRELKRPKEKRGPFFIF